MITKENIDQDHIRNAINNSGLAMWLDYLQKPVSFAKNPFHDHTGAAYYHDETPFNAMPGELQYRMVLANGYLPVSWYYVREIVAAYALWSWNNDKSYADSPVDCISEINAALNFVTYENVKITLDTLRGSTDLPLWSYIFAPYKLKKITPDDPAGSDPGAGGDYGGLIALILGGLAFKR